MQRIHYIVIALIVLMTINPWTFATARPASTGDNCTASQLHNYESFDYVNAKEAAAWCNAGIGYVAAGRRLSQGDSFQGASLERMRGKSYATDKPNCSNKMLHIYEQLNQFNQTEARQWCQAWFNYNEAGNWHKSGFTVAEAFHWRSSHVHVGIASQWKKLGFTFVQAQEWGACDGGVVSPYQARDWLRHGFTREEAHEWIMISSGAMSSPVAASFKKAGFSAREAYFYYMNGQRTPAEALRYKKAGVVPSFSTGTLSSRGSYYLGYRCRQYEPMK